MKIDADRGRAGVASPLAGVELAEIAELRGVSAELKLRQLEALAQSASLFEWPAEDAEDERVRELWTTLRRRMGIP